MTQISELAKIIRSKNAGPFLTTIDLFFDAKEKYLAARDSGKINPQTIALLYRIPESDVVGIYHSDLALGIKITLKKPDRLAAGDVGWTDTFGAQQHVPLLALEV